MPNDAFITIRKEEYIQLRVDAFKFDLKGRCAFKLAHLLDYSEELVAAFEQKERRLIGCPARDDFEGRIAAATIEYPETATVSELVEETRILEEIAAEIAARNAE